MRPRELKELMHGHFLYGIYSEQNLFSAQDTQLNLVVISPFYRLEHCESKELSDFF